MLLVLLGLLVSVVWGFLEHIQSQASQRKTQASQRKTQASQRKTQASQRKTQASQRKTQDHTLRKLLGNYAPPAITV